MEAGPDESVQTGIPHSSAYRLELQAELEDEEEEANELRDADQNEDRLAQHNMVSSTVVIVRCVAAPICDGWQAQW